MEKKSKELKTQDFISSDILSKDFRKLGLLTKVSNSRFFSRNFFSGEFLTEISRLYDVQSYRVHFVHCVHCTGFIP